MAEKETVEFLVAKNGTKASVRNPDYEKGPVLSMTSNWPLAEFDELVEFVREYQKNLKQAEVQTVG